MERQKGSGPALKAYLLATVGLVLPLWTTGGGLELQEWVLIRTVDGTVIASNYTWGGNTPITLKADFSKFFDDQFCESPAAVAVVNSLSNWQRPSVPFSPCDNAVKNYTLRYAAHYGCPEPPQNKVYPCGTYQDFYCRQWGCETLASGWAPGAGLDKHIILHRHPSKEHGSEWNENCSKDNCNPTTDQVTYLEKQVDSLAEVALQNRRGLDLLFLQQGGLCAALGEDCCLYANHSGLIRENIRTLTKRLKEREGEDENSNWYASLFKTSPWLTTLLSAIAGPLLILLLALTLGPIFLNRLLAFIKERIATVKLMVLSQPYTILPLEDEEFESRI